MATTITQGFTDFKSNLEITTLQQSTVSTRQNNVRDAVKAGLTVLDDFLTGSYKRSTMISPLKTADIDIFMVLSSTYFSQEGQVYILDKVKGVLKKTYPSTPEISRNGQAVTITFNDFKVDVVPAFKRTGGGYLIADSISGKWIATNPKRHVEIWSEANQAHDCDLVPIIKMVKCWNREHSKLLRSFHLECLVLKALDNITISDFPSGARYFFDKARNLVKYTLPDPAGYGGDVGAYLDTQEKIDEVYARLDKAYNRALDAESLAKKGYIADAFAKWRTIFGDCFPAYG